MRVARDKTGEQFGKLYVIGRDERRSEPGIEYVMVSCECGTVKSVRYDGLRAGAVVTCGCGKKFHSLKHGHNRVNKRSSEYMSWDSMIQRCTNDQFPGFHHYGGRGISVCNEWLDFRVFLFDMGLKPFIGASIERVNNEEGYCKENCVWATPSEQMCNTRRSRKITMDGVTKCISEWAKVFRINRGTVFSRIRSGWDPLTSLITPVKERKA